MQNNEVNCKEVMNHICDHLGEQEDSPRCVLIKQHLSGCKSCRDYFNSVESTISFYKQYNVTLSQEAHNRLFDMLGLNP